jgi:peptidoglycan/LPS O-acetylase OafA/YrhL
VAALEHARDAGALATGEPMKAAAERPHLAYVDGLRALAALGVLWTHGIGCAYRACAGAHVAWRDIGDRGVELFFVVSGFCLAYPFLARKYAGRPVKLDYVRFLVRRFSRIAPPYYAVLGLLALLALTPIGFPGNATLGPIPPGLAASTFARDVVFDTSGWQLYNLAFWTLGVEMHWYLVCPLLIALYLRWPAAFFLTMPLLYALSFFPPFGLPHVFELATLPCFMLGILAADLTFRKRAAARYALAVVPAALVIVLFREGSKVDFTDPGWHLLSFLIVVLAGMAPLSRFFALRPMVAVGVASYSIYLVHFPVIGFFERHGVPSWPATAIALGAGFAFWRLVEVPFLRPEVRGRIESGLEALLGRLKVPSSLTLPGPPLAPRPGGPGG